MNTEETAYILLQNTKKLGISVKVIENLINIHTKNDIGDLHRFGSDE